MRAQSILFAGLSLLSGMAAASGLQVSPVSLTLQPTQNADGLWLSNEAENVIRAQVRVYRWTQEGSEEKLTPSRGLVISPPMLQLAAADKQLVRVIRVGAPPSGAGATEEAYRVSIDELPIETKDKKGLQFVLHYSVPIFVEPVGGSSPPQLRWTLVRDGDKVALEVANSGGKHAQLADMSFVDGHGKRTEMAAGLFGYVLPGVTMRWMLKLPAAAFASGGTLEGKVNGEATTQNISLVDRPR